jgi:hypothetical protein
MGVQKEVDVKPAGGLFFDGQGYGAAPPKSFLETSFHGTPALIHLKT